MNKEYIRTEIRCGECDSELEITKNYINYKGWHIIRVKPCCHIPMALINKIKGNSVFDEIPKHCNYCNSSIEYPNAYNLTLDAGGSTHYACRDCIRKMMEK